MYYVRERDENSCPGILLGWLSFWDSLVCSQSNLGYHIRIRTTRISDTSENGLRSFGVPEEKLKETALINGGDLEQMIPVNTLIKVVEKGRERVP